MSLVKVTVVVASEPTVTVTDPVASDGEPTRSETGATVMEST